MREINVMRVRTLLSAGLALLAVVGLTMCGQPETQTSVASDTSSQADSASANTAGMDAEGLAGARSVQQRMRAARRVLHGENLQSASLEFSDVADRLSQRAARVSGVIKEDLQFSASELVGLAERLYSGPPVTSNDLDPAFSRVFLALASYHQQEATAQAAAGHAAQAAEHLEISALFLDEAIGYRGAGYDDEAKALIQQIRTLARQIRDDATMDQDVVIERTTALGDSLQQLTQQIRERIV